MAYLDDLNYQLQQKQSEKIGYENAKTVCEVNRDKAIKRRNKVEMIVNRLKNDFDNNVSTINKKIKGVSENIEDAIKGGGIADNLISKIDAKLEKLDESDGDLSNSISKMNTEYKALTAYIEQMNAQISTYNSSISQCNTSISSLCLKIANEQTRIRLEQEAAARKAAAEQAAREAAAKKSSPSKKNNKKK